MNREESVQHFLDLLKKSRRGNFKVYIGMIAGVGKSYRMLSEAHELLRSGIDVSRLYRDAWKNRDGGAGGWLTTDSAPQVFLQGKGS